MLPGISFLSSKLLVRKSAKYDSGLFLPHSPQVQFGQCLLIGQMVALGLDDDYLPGARSHDKIRIVVNKAIDGETRSRDIAMPPPDIG